MPARAPLRHQLLPRRVRHLQRLPQLCRNLLDGRFLLRALLVGPTSPCRLPALGRRARRAGRPLLDCLALGGLAATPGLPGLVGKGLQVAIPAIGGVIGGNTGAQLAESTKRFLTGDPTTGKDDLKNKLAERGLIFKQDLDIYDRTQGIQTSNILNLNQGIADQEYLNMQRMNPLLQKMENAKLVRAQALMASQGQQYAMLGTLATAGKLATGSQAEMGKTVRTVLGSNPYASANLQAPSVSFG